MLLIWKCHLVTLGTAHAGKIKLLETFVQIAEQNDPKKIQGGIAHAGRLETLVTFAQTVAQSVLYPT
jgi:2-oxoglutarate dehydrogenase complex dehydrogenase (E1) component-like enzyme